MSWPLRPNRNAPWVLVSLFLIAPALAQDPTPPSAEDLEQRIKILERKLELAEEAKAEEKRAAPSFTAGPDGFLLKSAQGDFVLRLRGYLQLDGRTFPDDQERPTTDTFTLRRARPILDGTMFGKFDFRLMPDFGGGTATIQDAYLEARVSPQFKIRAGKFKPPVGLERLQSATDSAFVERALPTALVPNRDLGLQLGGEVLGGKLEYAVGLFDGVVDGGSSDADVTDAKEIAGRLFVRPFRKADNSVSPVDLGLGLAVSVGDEEGSIAATALPSYRTVGQQSFFSYRSDATAAGTVFADGERTRIAPQGYVYVGPFGVLVEAVRSEQTVRRAAAATDLATDAWQVQLQWVLTGERAGFRAVQPRRPVTATPGGRGAWIVSARVTGLEVDDQAYPLFADSTRSARQATATGVGISWNANRAFRWMLDLHVTEFDGGAASGADRPDEKALFTRLQLAF
jgi:phosphate-selective porin OprO/OprP